MFNIALIIFVSLVVVGIYQTSTLDKLLKRHGASSAWQPLKGDDLVTNMRVFFEIWGKSLEKYNDPEIIRVRNALRVTSVLSSFLAFCIVLLIYMQIL